jgi:hypothetical protein
VLATEDNAIIGGAKFAEYTGVPIFNLKLDINMKKTGINVMKKITIDFEQHSLEYFTYHAYNSNEFKTLKSIKAYFNSIYLDCGGFKKI